MQLNGIAVSPGFAIGRVFILETDVAKPVSHQNSDNPTAEILKLKSALAQASDEIQALVDQLKASGRKDQAEIFEAHLLMVQDPELIDPAFELIEQQKLAAISAYKITTDRAAETLSQLEDEYLSARATDVRDIAQRVAHILSGKKSFDVSKIPHGSIIVGHDITPSQMALIDPKKVVGFITEIGGKTSHTAILARSLELPAIAGARGIFQHIGSDTQVIIDAMTGKITITPTPQEVEKFQKEKTSFEAAKNTLLKMRGLATVTKDGYKIDLGANIGTIQDLPSVLANDAEGVGLYRTEFVFMDKKVLPSEEEQYRIYREIFQTLGEKKCIIRSLDIGGDKALDALPLPHEMNPFLGLRAVRLCLQEKGLFKNQLKAILRASLGHHVGLMIPMISCVEEIIETRAVLSECKVELKQSGVPYSESLKFGVMIEIPSAAMIVDLISRHVDFISIGTNDLTQYMCAVDRLNDRVEALYNPYNPGFLRVLNLVFKAANENKIHAGICGSLAHSELLVPLFVGMGVHELSMTAQHVLGTRKAVRELDRSECQKLVSEVLMLETSNEIKERLKAFVSHK